MKIFNKCMCLVAVINSAALNNLYAQDCKSYLQMEMLSPSADGPITASPGNTGLWVVWDDNNATISMMDGTVWEYSYIDEKNNSHYKYKYSTLSTMPGVTYHEAVIIPDKTKIRVSYTFSLMGSGVEIYATYGYIGEGKQPAIECFTDSDSDFSYSSVNDRYRTFVKTRNKCSRCSGCTGYWGYKHGNNTYEGSCSNTDGHGHTCGHGPEKHGLKKW